MRRTHLMLLNILSIGYQSQSKISSRSCFAFVYNLNSRAACRVHKPESCHSLGCYNAMRLTSSRAASPACEMTPNEAEMRKDALKMIRSAIQAVDPYIAVRDRLRITSNTDGSFTLVLQSDDGAELSYHLANYDTIKIFSFGKASAAMAIAVAEVINQVAPTSTEGTVIIKDDHATPTEMEALQNYNIAVRSASHPVPDERAVSAANEILVSASSSNSRTLILNCISGGGSALFCSPREPLTLQDLADTNSALLKSGMPIEKMNIIRKRLENGKGGKLASTAYPATVLTMILSDIIGDPLDLIASGPTVADESGWEDAMQIVEDYGLDNEDDHQLPAEVLKLLRMGCEGLIEDTAKHDNPAFSMNASSMKYTENVLVGNNYAAVIAAASEAEQLGYHPVVLGTRVEGEASCVAGMYVSMAEMLSRQRSNKSNALEYQMTPLPVALIAGGETTVTLPPNSNGKGGRNQELALVAAIKMREIGLRDVVLTSVGTDGTDGPTDAAGAMVDGNTVNRIEETSKYLAKEALRKHDAYTFFDSGKDDSLIRTGPTGTNVADVCITLVR